MGNCKKFSIFFLSICPSFFWAFGVFGAENTEYIGVPLGLDFYSQIDSGVDTTVENIRRRQLGEYPTFQNFGSKPGGCRPALKWLDGARMDEAVLMDANIGVYNRIIGILAEYNRTHPKEQFSLDSNSLANLVNCLAQTYNQMTYLSASQESAIAKSGNTGLYSDGDMSNSEYDIIADISKINSILFTEKIDYVGTKNMGRTSLSNFINGKAIGQLFTPPPSGSPTPTNPDNTGPIGDTPGSGQTGSPDSLGDLGIGAICQKDATSSPLLVSNMVDADFLAELEQALYGYAPVGQYGGSSYAPSGIPGVPDSGNSAGGEIADFFHKKRCDSVFCIDFGVDAGSQNVLGGGSRSNTIQTILEKHILIMEPISYSDLSAQKMTNNVGQVPYFDKIFGQEIPPTVTFMQAPPQTKDRYTSEQKGEKEKKFEAARKCAFFMAGLSTDSKQANSIAGAGFSDISGRTSSNIVSTSTKVLGPISVTDQGKLEGCFDIAMKNGRKTYYQSITQDFSEIEAFTRSFVNELESMLNEHKKIDTLPVK